MTKTKVLSMMMVATMFGGCFATGPLTTSPELCDGESPDTFACTDNVCNADTGLYVGVPNHVLCGAGRFCRPEAADHDAAGCVGTPPPVMCPTGCDDHVACTVDSCNETTGLCDHNATDDLCRDGETCRHSAADGASGCYLLPVPTCATGCDDHVDCTTDRCTPSGDCVSFVDESLCSATQHCVARRGCVDDATPPPPPPPVGDFACVFEDGESRIGYTVRLCARDMSGVRTVPNRSGVTQAMTNSGLRTWRVRPDGSYQEVTAAPGGCLDYALAGVHGGINTHPFISNWRTAVPGDTTHSDWDLDILNVADFRSLVGRSAASLGIEAYVCQSATGTCADGEWTELPEEFYMIAPDTVGRRYWVADPNLHPDLTGEVAIRAVLNPGCDETGAHPAL